MRRYVANRGDACFYCKTELYSTLQGIRSDMEAHARLLHMHHPPRDDGATDVCVSTGGGSSSSSRSLGGGLGGHGAYGTAAAAAAAAVTAPLAVILYNGTNKDDLGDSTRVGLVAAADFDVRSPLRDITKVEVRAAAKHLGK